MYLKVSEIREIFLNYFSKKGHKIVPSSPLLPQNDTTLLFTTAGMVQFKSFFSENVKLSYTKAASSQKCLRTTDLEQVGKTDRHCTYFEMLGNFSFGDYFKQEAIEYALDFSINYLKFPKEKIWITIFLDDNESSDIWESLRISKDKIIRLGKKDNFWGPVGETGVCGPCSELYFDRGIEKGCGKLDCKPGCDCDRFIEFWNIVFNQYHKNQEGNLSTLKKVGIDTGAGLERIATLAQNVDSVYETNELKWIINFIEENYQVKYEQKTLSSFRVIADHIRAVSFAIGDNIFPDRIGRGYVIRRLIRRALLASRNLKIINQPSLYCICDAIYKVYSDFFPEIKSQIHNIKKIIYEEENIFLDTLTVNLEKLNEIISIYEQKNIKTVTGKDLFLLYGTYGFPIEIVEEILLEKGFSLDKEEFKREVELDKKKSRSTWQKKNVEFLNDIEFQTKFLGYELLEAQAIIKKIFSSGEEVNYLSEKQNGILILDQTPFYPESGGQRGDKGEIIFSNRSMVFSVIDTQKEGEVILHFGKLLKGKLHLQDKVQAQIDIERRKKLKIHHSGTHLLNFALRNFLGNHIFQKSSLVEENYLRFDFSHSKSLSEKEIEQIEYFVNQGIQLNIPVMTNILPIQEAKQTGAVANFDEKYGEIVRVVQMGDRSIEFCGGTHVKNTSEIQIFTINKEASSGVAVRRIEAMCGVDVIFYYYQDLFLNLEKQKQSLILKISNTKIQHNLEKVKILSQNEIRNMLKQKGFASLDLKKTYFLSKRILEEEKLKINKKFKNQTKTQLLSNEKLIKSILQTKKNNQNYDLILFSFDNQEIELLKLLGDSLKNKDKDLLICFLNFNTNNNLVTAFLTCSYELTKKKVHCGDLIKRIVASFSGRGGGKINIAQGGFSIKHLSKNQIEQQVSQILTSKNNAK